MTDNLDGIIERQRALQGVLQGEYPDWRVRVEPVATGGFDGFRVWASRPDDGKRTVVYEVTRVELSSRVVADVADAVRSAIASTLPTAQSPEPTPAD